MNNILVVFDKGKWAVCEESRRRTKSVHRTAGRAIDAAAKIARARKTNLIIVNRSITIKPK